MEFIRKKNAIGYFTFPMVDSTTPASLKTGLSPVDTAYYKDTSGAWTALAIADTASEIGSTGMYEIDLSATEMNHDQITIKFTVAGAQDQVLIISTIPQVSDMMNILGTAVPTPATAGILDVNMKNIANAAVSTSTAQIGVNVIQAGGTAWGSGAITAGSIASSAIAAAKIATGAITNAKFAAGAIDAAAIATGAIDADALATDAVTEIQNGLATPTNITAGTITTVTNLTNAPTNGDLTATMKASVNTEVDTAITDVKLDHLIAVAESGDVVNSSIIAKLASKSATPAFSSFNNTTDSLEAIADNESPAEVTANVTKIDGVALSTHSAGMMPSDMKAIDNNATSGNNATLNLKKLDITNVDGLAVNILGYGNDTNGVQISGGLGVYNAHGDAINVLSAGTGGEEGQVGRGVSVQSYQSDAIHAQAGINGSGFSTIGEGTGSGILANSGTSNGSNNAGIHAVGNAPNSHGMSLVSGANGNDLNLETPSTNLEAVVDQEAVRNAMLLAPTGDDPASGSIDDKLDDIKSQTDKMNFTGDNIDANTEAIDTNAGAAAKLAASADTESLCTVDTSRPFAPTTTEFETASNILAKDRWVIFRSGVLIGQAKPVTACVPISGKSHITTEAFTAAPSNADTFVIV